MTSKRVKKIIKELEKHARPDDVEWMRSYGIKSAAMLGVRIPDIRAIAKRIGKDHALALELWRVEVREARILASLVDESEKVTSRQMDSWAKDFDSWDICDQCCLNLFRKTPYVHDKISKWTGDRREFVKRAGFVLIATLAVHEKDEDDKTFIDFLPIIKREANDDRVMVKKAVNWALRQIGKKNKNLHKHAIKTAKEIKRMDSKAARWVAGDALRELEGVRSK